MFREVSYLKEMGHASDVLAQLPFVTREKDKFTVFGKGTPLIYINNRLIRDLSELESINSNAIKKINVITNTGSEYDATVKSIIKIETIKRIGDGLSGNILGSAVINRKFSSGIASNPNYRINKIDIFGSFYYSDKKDLQNIDWEQSINMSSDNSSVIERRRKQTELSYLNGCKLQY